MKILGFPWTIRTRLSLLYAGAFLLAGLALVTFMYLFLGQVIDQQFMIRTSPGAPPLEAAPGDLEQGRRVIDIMIRRARVDTLQTVLVASLIIVAILTVLAGIIGWLVAGQALQPLRNITGTARRVADRSLHERIALTGPKDEIKDLADTLDDMLERLDRSFDSQRRFVANASHELRTPLTIARTLIEVALLDAEDDSKVRQLGTTLLAVNQRHEKLTDGLLTLASSEQRAADFQAIELSEIAVQVASDMRAIADKASVALETKLHAGIVMGDAFLLERLIQNLIENGIQYNVPDGGFVRVTTSTSGGNVELVVENTGSVVPAYEVAGLFEPFRRLAATDRMAGTARASIVRGAGLGLSIVRSVAHAHAGTVDAISREGGGLIVRVRIPAAADLLTAT
jgi:signal transduction histidine kinase